MRKTRKIKSSYKRNNRCKRRRPKTIKKLFEGGSEEKKTFLGVIGKKAQDIFYKGADFGLRALNLKRVDSPPPSPPSPSPIQENKSTEPNQAVVAVSNLTNNLTDAANSVVQETLNFTDKLNNPETVKRLEEGLNNAGKILDPIVDKVADKVADVIEEQSPKIAAAGTDMGVAVLNGIPGVGAAVSLGKEVNDIQQILSSTTESASKIMETVNEGIEEGVEKYEEIKKLNPEEDIIERQSQALANSLPTTNTNNLLKGGGAQNLKKLQRAGATISNRINDSISEFLKNKTHKNKKKVRFSV